MSEEHSPQYQINLSGRRLLVSEEGLINEVGHWYEYCKSVVDIHSSYGTETFVAMHADANAAVRSSMPALPVYGETSWNGMHIEPNPVKRYWGILSHNRLVYSAIAKVIGMNGPFDIIFAPTVTIHHLIGWRCLAALHAGIGFKRMVLLFRNNAGYYIAGSDTPKFSRSAQVLAFLLRSFSSLVETGVVVFATDSVRLADEYKALCGIRPVVFPSPRIAEARSESATGASVTPPAAKTLRFSCLGPARFEKGIDLLQEAIKRVLARGVAEVCFIIQWNQEIRDATGARYEPDPALLSDHRVVMLTEPLTSAEYNREVSQSDCMVLPYRRASYFARISGVAMEGVTAGVPIIFTRDTWCDGLVEQCGAGIGVPDGDVEALVIAIEEMASNYTLYKAKAMQRAIEARRLNSAFGFLDKLWGPLLPRAA